MSHRTREANRSARRAGRSRTGHPPVEYRALPTPERMRRAGSDFERGDTGQITMRDSPLERAFARNVVTQEQYRAAQKYRHHWYHAGLSDRLGSIDIGRIFAADLGDFSGMARTETQVFHRQRYREATQAAAYHFTATRRKPSARSDRMYSIGWYAATFHSNRWATLWAGAAVRKPMPLRSSA